ncbi:glycosyltransferase [Clostridia bacterium]|nr:glycosyltransferase [Clostridia bacterium]
MIILHVTEMLTKVANGPRFSVTGLTSALNRIEGVEAGVLNVGSHWKLDKEETDRYDFPFFARYERFNSLPAPFNHPDLIVFHGVYKKHYLSLWQDLSAQGIPYVVTPRVSLTKQAQSQKAWKKRLANRLIMNSFIGHASAIHYLTPGEMEASLRINNKYFIAGNGVQIPELPVESKRAGNRMIFIGRYDIQHKGLDVLMQAISHIKDELLARGLSIDLYGSGRKVQRLLERQGKEKGLENVLSIHGPIFASEKEEALQEADLFLACSRFEGLPMALLEAMSHGVCVLATPGTNMAQEVEETQSGWQVNLDFKELGAAILKAFEDKEELARRGLNARRLASEEYNWDRIAELTLAEYQKLLQERTGAVK